MVDLVRRLNDSTVDNRSLFTLTQLYSVVLTPVLTSEFHNICDCFGIALL